ncbi:tetratricopeptide repeat protein [Hyphomicrobium facile]|uniref:Tetratricopeptide repeat-containing protein n=1 Tax=Hyphomicrobium facile TaxID=51670 RepID=A0A1I7NTZ4_9HYPH|nr:tetratricopeptide repeat protein [Hyphomicrobium facile]SFV38139.1 Tetratricopeptide repeat-containing protein [Hyphomicrobium facile]
MTKPMDWSESDRKAIVGQLDRILSSEFFKQSERRRRFLAYIVGEALAGRAERLKGYTIALDVFDRPASFDPLVNPIVRMEAGRLRDKLRDYYQSIGRFDTIVVELPRGGYEPRIEIRREPLNRPERERSDTHFSTVSPRLKELNLSNTSHKRPDGPPSPEARDALLRGLSAFWRYTRQSCFEAQEHFSRAITLDKKYAAAHAWLARALVFEHSMGWESSHVSALGLAYEHSNRAVTLDGQSPMAQAVLGWTLLHTKDGVDALTAARRACSLEPNFPDGRLFLALALAAHGDGEAAMRNMETAMLLQPHPSSFYYYALGLCHFALAEYESAIEAFLQGIEINPSFMPNHYTLAITYGVSGLSTAAREEAAIVKADWPNVSKNFFLSEPLESISGTGKKNAGLIVA